MPGGIITVTYFVGGKGGLTAEISLERRGQEENPCVLLLFSAVFSTVSSFVGVKEHQGLKLGSIRKVRSILPALLPYEQ